jgi:sterol desaturase/sphingolipid hydroxylase (fatty acid hydroxylase superfamily)
MSEALHVEAVVIGIGTFFFHIAACTVLQVRFYYSQQANASQWKTQPAQNASFAEAHRWWLPLLRLKERHKPLHWLYATVNLFVAATAAMLTAELTLRRQLPLQLSLWNGPFVMPLIYSTLFQCTAEYHWHRLLHQPFLYARFHKIHHSYTAPEPF